MFLLDIDKGECVFLTKADASWRILTGISFTTLQGPCQNWSASRDYFHRHFGLELRLFTCFAVNIGYYLKGERLAREGSPIDNDTSTP